MPIAPGGGTTVSLAYNIGRRLRAIRNHAALNQKEFSEKIGISQSYLSEVENGKNKANIEIVAGIANAFPEVNTHWLLTGRGPMATDKSIDTNDIDEDAAVTAFQVLDMVLNRGVTAPTVYEKAKFFSMVYKLYMLTLREYITLQDGSEKDARRVARYHCFDIGHDYDPAMIGTGIGFGPGMPLEPSEATRPDEEGDQ